MIEKVILNPDKNLKPATIEWDEKKNDFVVNTPDGLTRAQLIEFTEEVKRITGLDT